MFRLQPVTDPPGPAARTCARLRRPDARKLAGVRERTRRPRQRGASGLPRGLAAAAVTAGLALAGCSKMDASLDRQTATVSFGPSTSVATLVRVRAACSHVPNVTPARLPSRPTAATVLYGLVFVTTNATDANLAELQECLQKFPSVQGVNFQDASDDGS